MQSYTLECGYNMDTSSYNSLLNLVYRETRTDLSLVETIGAVDPSADINEYRPHHADRVEASHKLFAQLLEVMRKQIGDRRSAGILLSAGVDSTVILAAACELRALGMLDEVHAFHYRWDHPGLRRETQYVRSICSSKNVTLHELDFTNTSLDTIKTFYSNALDEIVPQSFQYHITVASRSAIANGIIDLFTGVGGESICGDDMPYNLLYSENRSETISIAQDDYDQICGGFYKPPWIASFHNEQRRAKLSGTTKYLAHRIKLTDARQCINSLSREQRLINTCIGQDLKVHHPFLSESLLYESYRYPRRFNTIRFAGRVYDKYLLRLILHRHGLSAVSFREGSAMMQSSEHWMILSHIETLRSVLNCDSLLCCHGIIVNDELQSVLSSTTSIKQSSTLLMSAFLVELGLQSKCIVP